MLQLILFLAIFLYIYFFDVPMFRFVFLVTSSLFARLIDCQVRNLRDSQVRFCTLTLPGTSGRLVHRRRR